MRIALFLPLVDFLFCLDYTTRVPGGLAGYVYCSFTCLNFEKKIVKLKFEPRLPRD